MLPIRQKSPNILEMAFERNLMTTKTRHLGGVPLLCPSALSSYADCELAACLLCRAEAGVSRLTFSKCHNEGEMHSCNLDASVKTSQRSGGLWKLPCFIK